MALAHLLVEERRPPGWSGVALAPFFLLLRRLPAWFLLRRLLPSLHGWRETLFNGWFGPSGIAALFYAAEVRHTVDGETVRTVASLAVSGSITVHGTTSTPWTQLLGKYAMPRGPGEGAERDPGGTRQVNRSLGRSC